MLRFDRVTQSYKDGDGMVEALRAVSFAVGAGEFVVAMGPSGSGKTTLVNLASGIDTPTVGRVFIDGVDVGRANSSERARLRRRTVGVVFQEHELDPVLSAYENVALPLALDRIGADEQRKRVEHALSQCSVLELASRRPDQMSGGQRQRVAIARAIVGAGKTVIVADEPTAMLDSASARMIVELFVELRTTGVAILMTTHDARLAGYADRVLMMRDGELVTHSDQVQE